MTEPLDLDAIRERRAKAERWHEGVHYGLNLYAASSDDVPALIEEIERMRAERKADIAEVVREVVGLAAAEISPEWVKLVKDVNDGLYTPLEVQP